MGVSCIGQSWQPPPALGAGDVTLQKLVASAPVTGEKGSSACPRSPGQEQRQLELQKLWAEVALQPGQGLEQPPKGSALKKE